MFSFFMYKIILFIVCFTNLRIYNEMKFPFFDSRMSRYDVELYQRIEALLGIKLELFPTADEVINH